MPYRMLLEQYIDFHTLPNRHILSYSSELIGVQQNDQAGEEQITLNNTYRDTSWWTNYTERIVKQMILMISKETVGRETVMKGSLPMHLCMV